MYSEKINEICKKNNFKLFYNKNSNSTNSELKKKYENGYVNNAVLYVDEQINGRGRQNNKWFGAKGDVFLSIGINEGILIENGKKINKDIMQEKNLISNVSIISAISVYKSIYSLLKDNKKENKVKIKWPNDIFINNEKIAGILIEKKCDFFVIGIGANVISSFALERYDATSLKKELLFNQFSSMFHRNKLIFNICHNFFSAIDDFYLSYADYYKLWSNQLLGKGEKITVRIAEKEYFGVFVDTDKEGKIIVNIDGKIKKFNSGEVFI